MGTLDVRADAGVSVPPGWSRLAFPFDRGALIGAAAIVARANLSFALPAALLLFIASEEANWLSVLLALLYGLAFLNDQHHRRNAREAVVRLETSYRKQRELEVARHRAEIATLEALIKPHFVFNALNGITTLIHEDPQKAEETVLRLARLMRYLLEIRSGEMMSLQSEMGVIKAYLEIERVRMGSRLAYDIDVPADLLPIAVPALVLQPLMENAVRHGVWERGSGGFIRLRASRRGDCCEIEIADNGPGFKPRQTSGHSLELVRDRLRRLYGNLYELRLERDGEAGQTTATLRLPLALPRPGGAS